MATRLEGVMVPVELDTSKAQRQLDDLESGLGKQEKTANKIIDTLGGKKGRSPSGRMIGGMDLDLADDLHTEIQRLIKVDRMAKFGAIRIDAANKANTISGKLSTMSDSMVGDTLPAAAKLAAGLYAGASAISKAAPLLMEVGRSAVNLSTNDPNFKILQDHMNSLQNSFNYIESYVKSAVTGLGKTYDMATAVSRVTGKVPNLLNAYGLYKEADMQEDMLSKRFEFFKSREVAEAVGRSMSELFKEGINR